MLLKLLYEFAHSRKLLDDLAFENKPVRWIIQLNSDGSLRGQGPIETTGEKNRGKPLSCPRVIGDTNSGKVADFLAEGIDGIFGLSPNPQKPKNPVKLAAKHQHFWDQIKECFTATEEPALAALLRFYENQTANPPEFLTLENGNWLITSSQGSRQKLGNEDFTFKIGDELLLENAKIRDYWQIRFFETSDEDDGNEKEELFFGICLVTGKFAQIARTHNPKIQGVPNTQPSGAKIVSFEKSSPSFSSFGFKQSYNASISQEAATAYCIAIRWLLADPDHHHRMAGVAVCFWARESKKASSFFAHMLNRPYPASVANFLKSPWFGIDREFMRHDQFYSVTLSGNAGRIVVRHWIQTTLEEARENLIKWFSDLEIATYGYSFTEENSKQKANNHNAGKEDALPPLALYRLACSTVREVKQLQAETLSQLYRASLEGTAPSIMLLKPILNRLNADICRFGVGILETPISYKAMKAIANSKTPIPPPGQSRMALVRLILNRNLQKGRPMIEPQVFETDDPAYNCGRLLAVFDDLQMKAHEYKLEGAGVVERYYGSACSSPNSAFGILWRLHQHHLRKVSRQGEKGKSASEAIKYRIAKIASLFQQPAPNQPPHFPRTFNLQEQGRFALGFYQQKAADDAARHAAKLNDNQPKTEV